MGVYVHLFIEKRAKKKNEGNWDYCSFNGEFSKKVYRMYDELFYNLSLGKRDMPADLGAASFNAFYQECLIDEKTKFNNFSSSSVIERNGKKYKPKIPGCDIGWCTSEELQECYNKVFKKEKDLEWFAIIKYMQALEGDNENNVRAVFWFED